MHRYLAILCACALLTVCLTGCSVAGAAMRTAPTAENRMDHAFDSDPDDRPRLPESLRMNETGIPQVRVYDVADKSIHEMDLETYVMGVLAGEMKNDWPMEALKAQAILARTFVLKFISSKESRYGGADISTDVSEAQAYNADAVNDRIRQAVEETRGLVMSDDGELPHAWFHAHSGGMTELPSVSLDYTEGDPDYLEPERIAESDSAPEDVKNWSATFTKSQLERACEDAGVKVGSITSVKAGNKGASGRVKELIINGKPVSAPTLRLNLDASKLKSTLITDISISGHEVTFTGRGFGHGVGMSQWGAYALAEKGMRADAIVEEFFDDVDIVRLWK